MRISDWSSDVCSSDLRRSGGFLLVDIDNQALINDAFGFENGDGAIVGLGERLDRLAGAGDVIGRVEGDAFGILLEKAGEARVRQLAERIIRSLADRSEEHTSELQSLMRISYAVFCLKKKKVIP